MILDDHIKELALEYQKIPDHIIFTGRLGSELLRYINEKGWNLSKFNLEERPSPLNSIVFKYLKAFEVIDQEGPIKSDSLDGKIINGIPGVETVARILNYSTTPSFQKHRRVDPSIVLNLVRESDK